MIKYLKKIAALTIAVVLLISSYSAVGITVSAATLENDDTDFISDNYGEYISNDELGELVSYNGYIAKSEYARLLNDESVGAGYYSPTFEGCYDTGGNQIYVRRAMARQYVGEAALMIWIGGSRGYCIKPGEPLNSGSSLEQTTVYGTWADLSRTQQQAINTALCYGREGNFSAIKGNTSINSDQCYIATQLIVWEIVNGERSSTAPYKLVGNGYLSMYCADGYNGNISEAYHRIENEMGKYWSIPSFAKRESATFLHESAHASGAKHRLNRDLSGRFGSESYAKEELRAEIASAFTASATGIKYEQSPTMENHAAYIQNWIKVLENNPNELFAAIKDAEKISDYLLEKGELIVKEPPEIADAEVEAAAEPTDENYRYREISYEDFRKLRDAGFDVADNCRQSTKHPDMVILRYTEQQAAQINAVLQPPNMMKR